MAFVKSIYINKESADFAIIYRAHGFQEPLQLSNTNETNASAISINSYLALFERLIRLQNYNIFWIYAKDF